MSHDATLADLQAAFPDQVVEHPQGLDFTVVVLPDRLRELFLHLRDKAKLNYLSNLTVVDRPERFEVVYHLYSTIEPGPVFVVKVYLPDRESAHVPSAVPVWQSAYYQEREAFDMFGVVFDGHPGLTRLLLWEGFPGHPLRKDFVNRTYSFDEMGQTLPPEDQR